jgi:tellurium resistance protein TerD
MAIVLEKGQRVSLGLVKAGIGLSWDPNDSSGQDYDLDASIFLLGSSGKLPADEFFVFYNNQKSPDLAVRSSGDDRTGGNSDGDDEALFIE